MNEEYLYQIRRNVELGIKNSEEDLDRYYKATGTDLRARATFTNTNTAFTPRVLELGIMLGTS